MTETKDPEDLKGGGDEDRRCRGRPQTRPDDETRQIIYEAARHEFTDNGYAATSMETVARRAGVSTKTLYRLVPNKAELFEGMVSDRLDQFLSEVGVKALRQHLGQLLGIAQVSRDQAEYEGHVRRIFGTQYEMDI